MKLAGKEITLVLSALAVEMMEEHFNKDFEDIFNAESTFKAKDISFMLHAMADTDMELGAFKKAMAKEYSYNDTIEMLTDIIIPPNETAVEDIESEQSGTPQESE